MSHDCPNCEKAYDNRRSLTTHHRQMHPDATEDRFWIWIDVGEEDECWEYQGSTTPWGHGLMTIDGEIEYVHRRSYSMHFEPPGDMQVNHHCDVGCCVNPNHLYLGDQSDNINDMWRRRRRHPDEMRAENAPNSKLTNEQAAEIKRRLRHETHAEIAEDYPVSVSTIGSIAAGDIWGSVDPDPRPKEKA